MSQYEKHLRFAWLPHCVQLPLNEDGERPIVESNPYIVMTNAKGYQWVYTGCPADRDQAQRWVDRFAVLANAGATPTPDLWIQTEPMYGSDAYVETNQGLIDLAREMREEGLGDREMFDLCPSLAIVL